MANYGCLVNSWRECINVIGNGFDGVTSVKLFKEINSDVVLINFNMPNEIGLYAIKKFKRLILKQE